MSKQLQIDRLTKRQYQLIIAVSLVVYALAASIAGKRTIGGLEGAVFNAVYSWPATLTPVFWAVTQVGSVWGLLTVATLAYAKGQRKLGFRVVYVGLFAYLLVEASKNIVERSRPQFILSGVTQRESLITGLGFPSGHTALVTALGLIVLPYLPRAFRPLVPLVIVLVMISRMYLGVHAPLDVVGGFCVGIIAATSYYYGVLLAKPVLAKRRKRT